MLYDDRELGPGEKFADAELLGCPLRLTVGRRALESGEIEVQVRRGREAAPGPAPRGRARRARPAGGRAVADPPVESGERGGAGELPGGLPGGGVAGLAGRGRMSVRRLFGLDRSGPPPPETLSGSPLRPWTVPNAIGFARLALIPVFLVVALSSSDGTSALAATLFAVIGWGDYADGIAARVTRQYSRLGALMDPVTDRLLVVSGVVVCWHFDLLPRWALARAGGARGADARARALRHDARGGAAHQLARTARGGAGDGRALLRDRGP